MLTLFNVILTVSQFQLIKHFHIGIHFFTPPPGNAAVTMSCLLAASHCIAAIEIARFLLVVHIPVNFQWLADSLLRLQLLTLPSAYVCKRLTALRRTRTKIPVFRTATTSCWEWMSPYFCTFEDKAEGGNYCLVSLYTSKASFYPCICIGHSKTIQKVFIKVKTYSSKSSVQGISFQSGNYLCNQFLFLPVNNDKT